MLKKLFKKQEFIMLVGLPNSGKTVYGKALQDLRDNTVTVSNDFIRNNLIKEGKITENNMWSKQSQRMVVSEAKYVIINLLQAGYNVCYDATNLNALRRKEFVKSINEVNPKIRKTVCILSSSGYSCLNRGNDLNNVIRRMAMTFEIPTYDEGWDGIAPIPWSEIENLKKGY